MSRKTMRRSHSRRGRRSQTPQLLKSAYGLVDRSLNLFTGTVGSTLNRGSKLIMKKSKARKNYHARTRRY